MTSKTAKRKKPSSKRVADELHPDQLVELIKANAMPCEIVPAKFHADGTRMTREEQDTAFEDARRALRMVGGELRDAQNAMVAEWLGYHYVAGTTAKLANREPGVVGTPIDLQLAMYHSAKQSAPTAHGDLVTTALAWLVRTIQSQRSPRTQLTRWKEVLASTNRQRAWHWSERQPLRLSDKTLRFDVQKNGRVHILVRVQKHSEPIRLAIKAEVATDRELRPNGPGTNGTKYNERLRKLKAELATKGAMLTEERGSFYFTFLERSEAPLMKRTSERTLFMRAGYSEGFRLMWKSASGKVARSRLILRDELSDLAVARATHQARRAEMKEKGIDARTNHGQTVKHYWANYTRTLCQRTASELLELAVAEGVDSIAVMAGDEWCALSMAGNEERAKSEPTRFPFASFAMILKQKAMERGISVVSRPNKRSVLRRKEMWRRRLAMEQVQQGAK